MNKTFLLIFVVFISAGCESKLSLEKVVEARNQSIRRTDVFQAISRVSESVVVVGNYGIIVVSDDAGKSWDRTELDGWPSLIDVVACPNGDFFTVAYEAKLWRSTDKGQTWNSVQMDTSEMPQALTCDFQNKLWVVGSYGSIRRTSDSGLSWTDQSLGDDLFLTNIQFVNMSTGYIVGEFGTLLGTSNSGESWERLPSLPGEFYPHTALFIENGKGWVGGLNGQILSTIDGGHSWVLEQSPTSTPIYDIQIVNGRLYAVGGAGVSLIRGDDKWENFEHGEQILFYIRAIQPINNEELLFVGGGGTLRHIDLSKN